MINVIANLETATTKDRRAVDNLTGTNENMAKYLVTINKKLITVIPLITTLNKQLSYILYGNRKFSTVNVTSERKQYYWTCGYRCEHNSWYCTTPATGPKMREKAAENLKR